MPKAPDSHSLFRFRALFNFQLFLKFFYQSFCSFWKLVKRNKAAFPTLVSKCRTSHPWYSCNRQHVRTPAFWTKLDCEFLFRFFHLKLFPHSHGHCVGRIRVSSSLLLDDTSAHHVQLKLLPHSQLCFKFGLCTTKPVCCKEETKSSVEWRNASKLFWSTITFTPSRSTTKSSG